nr:MAG TPA: hypothetical protein [Caudoviricetes sp.]
MYYKPRYGADATLDTVTVATLEKVGISRRVCYSG